MFSRNVATSIFLVSYAFSAAPTALAALSWDVCTTDANGGTVCTRRIPRSARLAIAVCCLLVLLLLLSLVICVFVRRRTRAVADQEYNVEANQVEGPPTIIATQYDVTSGPSRVYSAGPKSVENGNNTEMSMKGPTMPVAAYQGERPPTYTAPVQQTTFAEQGYPFAYDTRNTSNPPKTAFVTNGFPRPLLTGTRLKDRLKERPASVSGLTLPIPTPSH
jgi:hypothetical protein